MQERESEGIKTQKGGRGRRSISWDSNKTDAQTRFNDEQAGRRVLWVSREVEWAHLDGRVHLLTLSLNATQAALPRQGPIFSFRFAKNESHVSVVICRCFHGVV